jgi:hypothetical protein
LDDRTLTSDIKEVIQWVFKTNLSSVLIVGLPSRSQLQSKSILPLKAIRTSLNVVLPAVRQGKRSDMEVVATVASLSGRCFLPYAPNVAKRLKYRLNPERVNQFTAVLATVKPK